MLTANRRGRLDAEALVNDPAVSNWLKRSLQRALERDPVDAAADAALLHDVLDARCDAVLRGRLRAPRVYCAGPDVFRADVLEWRTTVVGICCELGMIPLLPCDNASTDPAEIAFNNLRMIQDADALVVNLNPFRGAEPDSGSVFEAAIAFATARPVVGYVSSAETVAERINRLQNLGSAMVDQNGYAIEGFGRYVNIMLAESFPIVVGDVRAALHSLLPMLPNAASPAVA